MKYSFNIFADYFQFYLEDEAERRPAEIDWTPQAVADLLVVGDNFIAVGTVRNMTVPVTIEIRPVPPDEEYHRMLFNAADQVVECSFEVTFERVVVIGCTEYYPDAPRITVSPGTYQVRLYYSGLDTLSEDGLDGDDHYHLVLFPGQPIEPRVLKQRTSQ